MSEDSSLDSNSLQEQVIQEGLEHEEEPVSPARKPISKFKKPRAPKELKEGAVFGKHYVLESEIGKGSFGSVWKAVNMRTKSKVAIKFEDRSTKYPQLHLECKLYLWFHQKKHQVGIPTVSYFGVEQQKNVMVIDLLGPCLEKQLNLCDRNFSIKTVLMLAYQMVDRIEAVHRRGIIHRDIKPENFVLGVGSHSKTVNIIDFGLAKKVISSKGVHIPYRDGKALTGTAKYVSINTHLGVEQARRDDLESLCYLFIYLAKGRLPWERLKLKGVKDKDKASKGRIARANLKEIKEMKLSLPIEDLCEGLPDEMGEILAYARGLGFEDAPDYSLVKSKLNKMMADARVKNDLDFDWDIDKNKA